MKPGDKVKARHMDATGRVIVFDGEISHLPADPSAGWFVKIGGVAILFAEKDLTEIPDGQGT
jgi:hypothetical protein